jgi:hypothetical protein
MAAEPCIHLVFKAKNAQIASLYLIATSLLSFVGLPLNHAPE